MPISYAKLTLLLLCGVLMSCKHNASIAKPVSHSMQQGSSGISYRNMACKKEVPTPYTGPLLIDSKYDQTDPTKSRLLERGAQQGKEVQEAVAGYTKGLVAIAEYYERNESPKHQEMALACLHEWLQVWSEAGALKTDEISKTGRAVRKWSLAAIASVVLKTTALSQGRFELTHEQQQWFNDLAQRVIADYAPRQEPGFRYFNNHDYWAGWAIAATGIVLNKREYVLWGDRNLRKGLDQVVLFNNDRYGYLPNEIARSQLAANYTHYALVPLVLLYESAHRHGLDISADEQQKMVALATFGAAIVLNPHDIRAVVQDKQESVAAYRMAWLIPFLSRFPDHQEARKLYKSKQGKVDGYSQIGGRIKSLYPNFKEE
jgi:poly(beta-D-mannuronate) lyase